jgi:protein-L-isoaspartate O-methyltransferase
MVIPVGNEMLLIEKDAMGRLKKKSLGYYVFVPLIGKHGHKF